MRKINFRLSALLLTAALAVSQAFCGCCGTSGASGTSSVSTVGKGGASGTSSAHGIESSSAEDSGSSPTEQNGFVDAEKETAGRDEGGSGSSSSKNRGSHDETAPGLELVPDTNAPEIPGFVCEGKVALKFAECFDVYHYEGGYRLIDIPESGTFLVVPENGDVPDGLDAEVTVLRQPLDRIYLAATSAMALFDALDAVDRITMSSL